MVVRGKPSFSTSIHFGLQPENKKEQWRLRIHCETCPRFTILPLERYKNSLVCSECIIFSLNSSKAEENITQIELGTNLFLPSEDLSKFHELNKLFSQWTKAKKDPITSQNDCSLHQTTFFEEFLYKLIQNENTASEIICSQCKKMRDKLKLTTLKPYFSKIPDIAMIPNLLYIGPYGEKRQSPYCLKQQRDFVLVSVH